PGLSNQASTAALELGRSSRRGRRTSSPPQFGQTAFICSAQFTQYVHSKLQMYATPLAVSAIPHFSHALFSSNAISFAFLFRRIFSKLSHLPVQVGTKIEFPNLDDTYHSIFSYSPAKRFDLGRYRPEERPIPSEIFDKPGLVTLRCDIHEHMRGLILVLNTPHFVVTDANGRFRLGGLPAGQYTLKAW